MLVCMQPSCTNHAAQQMLAYTWSPHILRGTRFQNPHMTLKMTEHQEAAFAQLTAKITRDMWDLASRGAAMTHLQIWHSKIFTDIQGSI